MILRPSRSLASLRYALAFLVAAVAAGCTVVGAPVPIPGPVPAEAPAREIPTAEPVALPQATAGVYAGLRPVRVFPEVRGLWVVRSSMTSEAEVREMVDRAGSAGFNTLIVQVRGRADAFYRSTLEPQGEAIEAVPEFDPLALAIELGHRRGMAVHAWVNTHLVWGPTGPPRSDEHLVRARPDWLGVPQALAEELFTLAPGDPRYFDALRRYADENRATVEGIYTSPSHPEVQARVHDVWMELLDRYDLDGIHFDYIRFPSGDFDYSRGALERFRAWMSNGNGVGLGGPADRHQVPARFGTAAEALGFVAAHPEAWDEFRRVQITALVRRIYHAVKARRPEVVVSAAVIADADDAYEHRFQDWRSWLTEGVLDVAVPMAYTPDNARFGAQISELRRAAGVRERAWAGVGAYLNGLEGTLEKIDLARAADAGGVVLFSYDWAAHEAPGTDDEPFLQRVGSARFVGP